MTKIILTVYRYGAPVTFEHESIEEAAQDALRDLEFDQAFPHKIEQDGKVLWEFDGDTIGECKALNELRRLARQNLKDGQKNSSA